MSRRVLLGVAALTVVGCGRRQAARPTVTTTASDVPPPADSAALLSARVAEQALLASYDAQISLAKPRERARLQVERAVHATHVTALHGNALTVVGGAVIANLPHHLRQSARNLQTLALRATEGDNAALLASIAASHALSAT